MSYMVWLGKRRKRRGAEEDPEDEEHEVNVSMQKHIVTNKA
jgi:hypothetical protein